MKKKRLQRPLDLSALDGKTTQRPQTEMTSVSIAKVTLVIKKSLFEK